MLTTSKFSQTQIHFFDPESSQLLISCSTGQFRAARVSCPIPDNYDDFELLEQLKNICVNQGLISSTDEIAMLSN